MKMERVTITLPKDILIELDHLTRNRSAFVVKAIRQVMVRHRRAELRKSLRHPHPESLVVAEEGFQEWAKGLPPEDLTDFIDPSSLKPVQWVEGKGWVAQKGR